MRESVEHDRSSVRCEIFRSSEKEERSQGRKYEQTRTFEREDVKYAERNKKWEGKRNGHASVEP